MSDKLALLVIDVQKGLDDPKYGQRNNPEAEKNIEKLIQFWRDHAQPLIHIQHASTEVNSPLRPDSDGFAIKSEAQPLTHEPLFVKNVNSAFIGTELESYLKNSGISKLVVVGLTTDHCVSTSVRMASNLGFTVTLVSDATATFERITIEDEKISAEQMHNAHLASLHGEFCEVLNTQQVMQSF